MARYNTVTPVTSVTSTATIPAPTYGTLTTFTGTAPYTVTLASPVLFTGIAQSFYNNTGGVVTLSSPSGNIIGPGFTAAASQTMPNQATYTLISDGTNYAVINNEGGPQIASTMTVNSTLGVTSTATFSAGVNFNGSSVTASSAFTPSNTYDLTTLTYIQSKYGNTWTYQAGSFTAVAGGRYFCNGGTTVTLPSAPTTGDAVHIIDYNGNFGSSNLTVAQAGGIYIMRQNTNMTVSTSGAAFQLVYSGAANPGWLVAQGI